MITVFDELEFIMPIIKRSNSLGIGSPARDAQNCGKMWLVPSPIFGTELSFSLIMDEILSFGRIIGLQMSLFKLYSLISSNYVKTKMAQWQVTSNSDHILGISNYR